MGKSAKDIILLIFWIIIVWWVCCPIFGICECFVRPISYPYLIFTNGKLKGKSLIFFILAIIPGFMIFAFIHGVWALFQFYLNIIPYCTNGCDDLIKKQPPDNVMPIIWAPVDKHPVYKALLEIVGKIAVDKPLNPKI